MRKYCSIAFLFFPFFIGAALAQTPQMDKEREQFMRQRQQALEEYEKYHQQAVDEYEAYRQQAIEEYEAYQKQAKEEYANYVKSIDAVWGKEQFADDTQKDWVEYFDDFRSRSIVDFENGKITVEVALNETEAREKQTVDEHLTSAIEKMLTSKGTTCPYESKVDVSQPLTKKPILEGLVDLTPYESGRAQANNATVKKNNVAATAKKIAEKSPRKVNTVKGEDGKTRKVVQVQMSLVKDNLSKSAMVYKDLVAEFSQKFQIEQPLIFAIIEQESAFNPEAKSWVPAYGLMQLVPTSGGRDAFRYVYKRDEIPTHSYLYNPRNNIELGTAYLRVLMNQFKSVTDTDCRRLCVIASYNTGAGNVSRAFIGATNLAKAFPKINTHNYNSLYRYLTTNLTHQEARNYVAGVTKKREKYKK